jgi:hypothetical protein
MKEVDDEMEKPVHFESIDFEKCNKEIDSPETSPQEKISVNKTEEEKMGKKQVQEKNLRVKRHMAAELERMGLSKKAVGRILNLHR